VAANLSLSLSLSGGRILDSLLLSVCCPFERLSKCYALQILLELLHYCSLLNLALGQLFAPQSIPQSIPGRRLQRLLGKAGSLKYYSMLIVNIYIARVPPVTTIGTCTLIWLMFGLFFASYKVIRELFLLLIEAGIFNVSSRDD
jgi:hypothetical protein